MRGRLALLVLIAVAAACAMMQTPRPRGGGTDPPTLRGGPRIWEMSGAANGAGPSYAIFPTQRLPLTFDHARHMALAGVTCVRCHEAAPRSGEASDSLVPPERTCTPCHAIDRADPLRVARPAARCDACHPGYDPRNPLRVARVSIPPPNLRFSHRVHVQRGARCEQCHGDMRAVGLATRLELPTMRSCFNCHRDGPGGVASSACTTCHLTGPGGTLRTHFAEGWLNPPAWMTGLHHDADFWFNHRVVAADHGARCAVCHQESDCIDCHDGRVRDRRTHPNDYVTLHAAEARQRADRCTSCHRTATFCTGCHQRIGVAESSSPSSRATGRFHPPPDEWSGRLVGARHHAMEARRAMNTCVSCHTERDCTSCHAATGMGGAGISPHPPGWLSRCGSMLQAAPRACAQCHDDLDALAGQCR